MRPSSIQPLAFVLNRDAPTKWVFHGLTWYTLSVSELYPHAMTSATSGTNDRAGRQLEDIKASLFLHLSDSGWSLLGFHVGVGFHIGAY